MAKYKKSSISLANPDKTKRKIMAKRQKEIRKWYRNLAKEIAKEAEKYRNNNTYSAAVYKQQLKSLQDQAIKEANEISLRIQKGIREDIVKISAAMVAANRAWMKDSGFRISRAFNSVPQTVLRNLVLGTVYKNGFNLSQRIWVANKKIHSDIYKIVANGIAMGKSTFDIAKDLERYVKPGAKKPWDWSKVYPGTNKVIDYNAQRLARTLTQHAYQQSLLECTQNNPFVTEYQWVANGNRTCPLCKERDGKIFKKDELPLDHPNGMCAVICVIPQDKEEIRDIIALWYRSPEGTFPDIDYFASIV